MDFYDLEKQIREDVTTEGDIKKSKKKDKKKRRADRLNDTENSSVFSLYLKTIMPLMIFIVGTVFAVLDSFYVLSDTQNAVVTTFGSPSVVQTSGIHLKIPFVQHVQKIDMTSRGMAIGYTVEDDATIKEEAEMITKDFNFLEVYFYIEYQVADAMKFVYNSEEPEMILSNLAQSAIRDTVGAYEVDGVLTTSRYEIQEKVKNVLMNSLDSHDLGIKINNATIQDVDTPTAEIKAAFDAVESAKQAADTAKNEANKYKEEQTPKAEGEADKIVQNATAQKQARIDEANGQVARFNSLYTEYVNAPAVTKKRMYYEAMEDVLPNVKVVIVNDNGNIVNVFNENNSNTENSSESSN